MITDNEFKGIRGGFVDYSKYKGYCCSCALRIPLNWTTNRCPQCNRLFRLRKKNKQADKLYELRRIEQGKHLVTYLGG